jgi:hypothetical protein
VLAGIPTGKGRGGAPGRTGCVAGNFGPSFSKVRVITVPELFTFTRHCFSSIWRTSTSPWRSPSVNITDISLLVSPVLRFGGASIIIARWFARMVVIPVRVILGNCAALLRCESHAQQQSTAIGSEWSGSPELRSGTTPDPTGRQAPNHNAESVNQIEITLTCSIYTLEEETPQPVFSYGQNEGSNSVATTRSSSSTNPKLKIRCSKGRCESR